MRMVELIRKKRNGLELGDEEIRALVAGFTDESIPDYQMAAWLMAVFFRGLSDRETAALTLAMARSGEMVDLSSVHGVKVDKHSTGGVADTTTLILAPLVAAAGVPVAKMSGRGLGFTGGTIDKLESIPGFSAMLSREQFLANLKSVKLAVAGQTPNIAPADGKIYGLRDVTGTVESIPLIASSIMSKKIAAGADKIVLDVKIGSGAFMKTLDDAVKLAETMVCIGNLVERPTVAVITCMDQPLGRAVGNSLAVEEAIDVLAGRGEADDLREVCLTLGGHMLVAAGAAKDFNSGYRRLDEILTNGQGLTKLAEFIQAQGGNPAIINNRQLLPTAKFTASVNSEKAGYVQAIDAELIGYSAMVLGAGREYKQQKIDLAAGLIMGCRIGEYVKAGQTLATMCTNNEQKLPEAAASIAQAITIAAAPSVKPPLIFGMVDSNGVHLNKNRIN